MNRLSALLVMGAVGATAEFAQAQTPDLLSADKLRRDLIAFAHDSMTGRLAGTDGSYRAANALSDRTDVVPTRVRTSMERVTAFELVVFATVSSFFAYCANQMLCRPDRFRMRQTVARVLTSFSSPP